MAKEQIFQESLTIFRNEIAELLHIESKTYTKDEWYRNINKITDRKSKLDDLKTWDILNLMGLLKILYPHYDTDKNEKFYHESVIKMIKIYRNQWAHL